MPSPAAITVLRSTDNRAVNKIVKRAPGGALTKTMALHSGRFIARTVPAPDVRALAEILREVGERADSCISLSLFRDAPEGEFLVVPQAELAARLGIAPHEREALAGFHGIDDQPTAARIKESMALGSWILFDRDHVSDMPAELAALSFADWRAAIDLLFPGFADAGCVVVPSTSTRVIVDGVPLSSTACHVYAKVKDPAEIERAWPQAALRALITEHRGVPLGFAKPKRSTASGEIVAVDWWTIFDKSVAATARLVFDGAPTIRGAGLKAAAPTVEAHEGPEVDFARVRDLMPRREKPALEEALEQIRGTRPTINLIRSRTGRVNGVELVTADLALDLQLETPTGKVTVGALRDSGAGHVRCHAPFRESDSWAAYFNVHRDGTPFVYDSGTGEKHVLARTGLATMSAIIRDWLIEDYRPIYVCRDGSVFSEALGRRVRLRDITPPDVIIDRMTMASDAPRDAGGHIKRLALPTQFTNWSKVAWAGVVRTLPNEDDIATNDEFVNQLAALLTSMVTLAASHDPTRRGTRSFGSWAYLVAYPAPGYWRRFETYDLWGRVLDDHGFQLALTPKLATQAPRTYPELAGFSLNQMTRRCRQYGISPDGDNRVTCKNQTLRAVILTPEFVASLDLSYDLDDPVASALQDGLRDENGGAQRKSKSAGGVQ